MSSTTIHTAITLAALGLLCGGGAQAAGPSKDQLVLWLKADSGLAANGSSWTDQSGLGHDATAIAGEAPTYVASAIKGLPAAKFSGAQAMTISGALLSSQQFTVLAVITDTGVGQLGLRRDIISNWSGSTGPQSIFFGTVTSTVSKKNQTAVDKIRFTDAIGGVTDRKNPEGGEGKIAMPTVPFELTGFSGAGTASIAVNGKTQYKLTGGLPARDLTMPWYIGQQGAANVEFFIGDIAEILVYNKALSAKELKATTNYLKKKWE